jgi:hypothetical protein
MAFGGRTGGRLQETTSPGRAQKGSWLGPILATAGTVWRQWQDRAMGEFTESESAFSRGPQLEAVAA